jgi:hypothetical protein
MPISTPAAAVAPVEGRENGNLYGGERKINNRCPERATPDPNGRAPSRPGTVGPVSLSVRMDSAFGIFRGPQWL